MRFKQLLFTGLLCGASLLIGAGTNLNARERGFTPATTPAVHTALSFVENVGQVHNQHQQSRPDIDFRLSASKGLSVFIGSGQIHYQWSKLVKGGHGLLLRTDGHGLGDGSRKEGPDTPAFKMYRMDVVLLGANAHAPIVTDGEQGFHERYFQPWVNKSNSSKGVLAHGYRKITYKNVYPNIDWVLYVKSNTVEYDFIVRPGGKVGDIRLQYGGATKLALQADGSLLATTPMGKVREQAPYSYDEQGRAVASAFHLDGNTLGFKTDTYKGILTIDPTVEWSTYFGGLGNDQPTKVLTDDLGNVYIGGGTTSMDNIATTGSYQSVYGGAPGSTAMGDAFVAKFNSTGSCLWATYYGGAAEDRGLDLAIDKNAQNIYLAGSSRSSSGIATGGAFQDTLGGSYDAYLVKFDSSGNRIWGTYYGGADAEGNTYNSIGATCDKDGNIYLTGETSSITGIATAGSYQVTKANSQDVFIVKFDSAGIRQWGTYLGGDGADYASRLCSDTIGDVFVVGNTTSTSGFATAGSYQSNNGGGTDGFIAKLDGSGSLQWLTYFGGSGYDYINDIETDPSGNCYLVASTESTTGISTLGSFQATYGGGAMDGVLAKFSNYGQILWSTYYGGNDIDETTSLSILNNNRIFISGYSISASGIATPGSYMDTLYNGTSESFLIKFDSSGQRDWGTYYGGSGYELYTYIASTGDDKIYLLGMSNSAVGIADSGAYQPGFGGGDDDAYLAKFNVCEPPAAPAAILGDTLVCSGTPAEFSVAPVAGATSYTWLLPSGWTGSSDSAEITITPNNSNGVIYVLANGCAASDSTALSIAVLPSPEPQLVQNGNILSTTQAYDSYQWNLNGQPINGATGTTYIMASAGSYSVTVATTAGCSGTSDTVLYTTGINNVSALKAAIKVSPNPAADRIYIQSPVPVDIKLSSIDGRELLRQENAKSINISRLSNGLYLLHLYDKSGRLIKVEKIIKKGR